MMSSRGSHPRFTRITFGGNEAAAAAAVDEEDDVFAGDFAAAGGGGVVAVVATGEFETGLEADADADADASAGWSGASTNGTTTWAPGFWEPLEPFGPTANLGITSIEH